jgi:hypothetical protein
MASIEVLDYRKDGEVEARGDDARLISGGGAIFIPERADFSGNDGWIKQILAPRSAIPYRAAGVLSLAADLVGRRRRASADPPPLRRDDPTRRAETQARTDNQFNLPRPDRGYRAGGHPDPCPQPDRQQRYCGQRCNSAQPNCSWSFCSIAQRWPATRTSEDNGVSLFGRDLPVHRDLPPAGQHPPLPREGF